MKNKCRKSNRNQQESQNSNKIRMLCSILSYLDLGYFEIGLDGSKTFLLLEDILMSQC